MSAAAFSSTADLKSLDVSKHVNYELGMVLGVSDFTQEFAYLAARTRWLARDAIGYGTLCGLAVTLDSGTKGPRVVVSAGTALTPSGQLVCVKPNQCAYLNDWLTANPTALDGMASPATLPLDLVLCYRECELDPVAIPGEPCRVVSQLTAPSRIGDSFALELRKTPPDQDEEDLLREFADWLRQVPLHSGGGTPSTVAQIETALRNAVQTIDSPIGSPIEAIHLNAATAATLHVDPSALDDAIGAALRIWTTEIRPRVHPICPGGCGCCGDVASPKSEEDDCLLLAHVDVPVVKTPGGWQVSDTLPVRKDESRRPLLVQSRLQQEWLQWARMR
jgi:hypothetical protein